MVHLWVLGRMIQWICISFGRNNCWLVTSWLKRIMKLEMNLCILLLQPLHGELSNKVSTTWVWQYKPTPRDVHCLALGLAMHKLKYFPHKLGISPCIQGEKVPLWFLKLFLKEHSIHVYNQGTIKMVVIF